MDEAAILKRKEKILDIAAEIIMEDGYRSLSMRKIGIRSGMTAANLYNHYSNKDELNIAIRMRAGRLLYKDLSKAYETENDISEKIWLMARAYMRFGLLKPNYYSIMFDMQTPKYADYIDSYLETLAREEKESSEKNIELLMQCARDYAEQGYDTPKDPNLFLILIWSQLHGLVSLYNNKLIAEIDETPDETIEEATRLAYEMFIGFFGKESPGGNMSDNGGR